MPSRTRKPLARYDHFSQTSEEAEFLICFLNSPLSEYLFAKIGTTTGVGTVRWKKFKLEQLFVPQFADSTGFFHGHLTNWLKKKDVESLRSINNKIYALCGLSDEEISFIERASRR